MRRVSGRIRRAPGGPAAGVHDLAQLLERRTPSVMEAVVQRGEQGLHLGGGDGLVAGDGALEVQLE